MRPTPPKQTQATEKACRQSRFISASKRCSLTQNLRVHSSNDRRPRCAASLNLPPIEARWGRGCRGRRPVHTPGASFPLIVWLTPFLPHAVCVFSVSFFVGSSRLLSPPHGAGHLNQSGRTFFSFPPHLAPSDRQGEQTLTKAQGVSLLPPPARAAAGPDHPRYLSAASPRTSLLIRTDGRTGPPGPDLPRGAARHGEQGAAAA